MLISGACGKRKPPLPPVERVQQRVEISGSQRGNRVFLTWRMPNRNAPESSLLNISRADIYRLAEPAGAPTSLSEEEFASRSTLISTTPLTAADFGGKEFTFTDSLDFAGQAARLRYAVRLVNASGQKAGFSNFLTVEPTARVAEAPGALKATPSQDAVLLEWKAPVRNIDGAGPANIVGYNVYRADNGATPKQLNKTPVNRESFADQTFEFERPYLYFVRTVSLGVNGDPIESLESETVAVLPKDVFPPSAPASITIAASPQTVSIFFATNPERDIAGYRIYRSTDPALPKAGWTLLTSQLLTTNTFQDRSVESGRTYHYYITAVDRFGNVSQPSETVSETVP